MDEDYQKAQRENMTNPKNRFLGCFCHAKEVDNSWGCDWSFSCGVILFSFIIGIGAFSDIYYIAKEDIFTKGEGILRFMLVVKIISDFISFAAIGISCFAVHKENLTYSIVSYYVAVLSFLIHSLFLIYCLISIFGNFRIIGFFIFPWAFLEFCLLLFCWILFANQVYLGRKRKAQVNQTGY